MNSIIDDVIDNNKQAVLDSASGLIVSVVYNGQELSDPTDLKNLKSSFDKWTDYEVSVEYNNDGYIYQIIIEDIEQT